MSIPINFAKLEAYQAVKQLNLHGIGGRATGLVWDYFAGGGGASTGIELAIGRSPDCAVNHDPHAILMHSINHPNTYHVLESVWKVDPSALNPEMDVWLVWFSPDCRHFSRAKGKKPVSKKIRGLAWVVPRVAAVRRPEFLMLENVPEFLTWGPVKNGQPIQKMAGTTFRQWKRKVEALGYRLEWRVVDAADYGAATHRRRLMVIARRDQGEINWPAPTHGPGRAKPWKIAGDHLDFTDLGKCIFNRKKKLACASQRRLATGLLRFALSGHIVTLNHSGKEFRGQSIGEPFKTITASRDAHGLVVPQVAPVSSLKGTLTNQHGPETLTSSVWLVKNYSGVYGHGVDQPIGTITSKDHHQLAACHLTKLYGTSTGAPLDQPIPTITGQGQHLGLVSCIVKYYGTGGQHQDAGEPLHTVTAKSRFGLVTADITPAIEALATKETRRVARFMLRNLKIRNLRKKDQPAARAILAQAKRGIITVQIDGNLYAVVGITLRMLTPRELARCQGFPDSYQLIGSKTQQIARIGNSVPPPLAEAMVKANLPQLKDRRPSRRRRAAEATPARKAA